MKHSDGKRGSGCVAARIRVYCDRVYCEYASVAMPTTLTYVSFPSDILNTHA